MNKAETVNMAEKIMRSIVRMGRNPLLTRRGNIMIANFLEKAREPEPKKQKAKPAEEDQ